MTPFLDAAIILRYHVAHQLLTKIEVYYLRNMVWNALSVRQMMESGMFDGVVAENEMWRHGERMSVHGIADVYFATRRKELIESGYTIM